MTHPDDIPFEALDRAALALWNKMDAGEIKPEDWFKSPYRLRYLNYVRVVLEVIQAQREETET